MSANPPKHDAWPPWRDTRFVLVASPGKLRPNRGLVLDWRRDGRRWEAWVVYYDDAALQPGARMGWISARDLTPVQVDPNLSDPPARLDP